MSKLRTADEVAALIEDGMTIGISIMGLAGWAEEVAQAIERRFLATGHPRDLTIVSSSGAGDDAEYGVTRFGHEGLTRRWIAGIMRQAPKMVKLVQENKIEAYNLPQGVVVQLWREIAAKRPGLITKVGLGTYIDPRIEGGKMNSRTTEDIIKVIEIDGEEYLFYPRFHVDVALIRGSVADENGNLTMDREGILLEALPLAQAAKNCGGIVIAQAEEIAQANTLHPKQVRVPGILVDYIVQPAKPEHHMQTEAKYYVPSFAGEVKIPLSAIPSVPLGDRKIIARRAAMELTPGAVVNLGIGIPADVAAIAAEENTSHLMTLTTEAGTIGGVPASPPDFGHAYNPEAVIEHQVQFDFYDGGGIDIAFLGMAQADKDGNVNVTKFGTRVVGSGGFINISQNSRKVVYCGTFTAGGLEVEVKDGKLTIVREGKFKKFVDHVDQISYSGKYARQVEQPAVYVTERAVFTLEKEGLTLTEIAPGIDLEKDVLAQMGFKPIISPNLKTMDPGIFSEQWGGLAGIVNANGKS
ncbi:MAG TPA: acyl CoA:acetate/3-ketoacid CoA transferase [Firmicutes bacterium]|nr:acyl CoA:acetate/3-ketoacid CoA transferase [Bacillota bacterium]